ncbi:unnamed protein product [Macrosiphum euphorbiae]|uniref:Uncharacterized protein n=1 Tax=Macrosiphum euphorbiae TaxID=13131 RepID=A0AAV0X619_9HEMI|nr:unnamed protein product [Macrosiphum euphorbiae]
MLWMSSIRLLKAQIGNKFHCLRWVATVASRRVFHSPSKYIFSTISSMSGSESVHGDPFSSLKCEAWYLGAWVVD